MAEITYRANLSAVSIPLISEEFGRSIIVKQQDQNFVPTVVSKADQDKDIGIPQVYYAHNVMPTGYGYISVGFSNQIAALPSVTTFSQIFPFFSTLGEKAYLAINTDGALYTASTLGGYVWKPLANTFSKVSVAAGANVGDGYLHSAQVLSGSAAVTYTVTFTSATAFNVTVSGSPNTTGTVSTLCTTADGKTSFILVEGTIAFASGDTFTVATSAAQFTGAVTQATTAGITYLCISGQGVFSYDYTADTLYSVVPTGINVDTLLGISSAAGYLVAYSGDAVAWSSLIDAMDFVPSLVTGAGGGSVEGARGPLRKCVAIASGFLVFTAANAVAATTTNNARYPFIFKEIPNCGGLTDLTLCTEEAEGSSMYAYTTNGLQQVTATKATTIVPEITDFLGGQYFEDFDVSMQLFIRTKLSNAVKKRLEYISGRYLVISFGISTFTHAIIYDTALQRYGKIKIPHTSALQYGILDADSADTPKRQVAFLQADGAIKTLDFSAAALANDSVLILGKFQYVRSRMLQLQAVEVETVDPDADFTLYDLPSLDGKSYLAPIAGYLKAKIGGLASYSFRNTALNHSLVLGGGFRCNSVLLTFNVHGAR